MRQVVRGDLRPSPSLTPGADLNACGVLRDAALRDVRSTAGAGRAGRYPKPGICWQRSTRRGLDVSAARIGAARAATAQVLEKKIKNCVRQQAHRNSPNNCHQVHLFFQNCREVLRKFDFQLI